MDCACGLITSLGDLWEQLQAADLEDWISIWTYRLVITPAGVLFWLLIAYITASDLSHGRVLSKCLRRRLESATKEKHRP